jgi:4-hydroxybenzoyl-CoA thioesterase
MLSTRAAWSIEWGDCDPAGIVFYPRYFAMFDASTAALFSSALGMTKKAMLRHYDVVGFPWWTRGRRSAPLRLRGRGADRSAVTEFRRASFDVHHRLLRDDGALAVEGFETRVWVGRHPDKPTASRRCPSRRPGRALPRPAGAP